MTPDYLKELLHNISSARISVVGDFCLDAYWFVNESAREISVETGLATIPVEKQKYSLGGAGNVTANLAALQTGEVKAFGVIGTDPFGSEMLTQMSQTGINASNLIVQHQNWSTHVYIKPYAGDKELNRTDFGNFNILSDDTADRLIELLKADLPHNDLVIINEQVLSGIHTPYFRKRIAALITGNPDKIFIADSRHYNDDYQGAIRKMNDTEAVLRCGIIRKPGETVSYSEVVSSARTLSQRYEKPVFITRGSRGSLVCDGAEVSVIPGLMILSKVDSVGAGDSYLAGVAAAMASGYKTPVAAELGSYVAGVTVQKLFTTGTASPEEIMSVGSDPDLIYNQELADNIRQAEYHQGTEIEIISKKHPSSHIRYAVFDHDGTISTLREGWENIMAPMMIKAILGNRYSDADENLFSRVETDVKELIDKTTGIQTLQQMKLLTGLVRSSGYVKSSEVLNEHQYKQIYNEELLLMVREREAKFRKGELTVEDLTMKGATRLLEHLSAAGITLFLASGTDIEDVKSEAGILGYAAYFKGSIFGATGDLNNDAKKVVLNKILELIGRENAASIITFGDGPVEIRETHKRGGYTVGLAGNEQKRFGLNIIKRRRLISAGADIIVPDFSQTDLLLKYLKIS